MRIYLDNCCYNRSYDDQSQLRVMQESNSIKEIQHLIINKNLELVTSFILLYENDKNKNLTKKQKISDFIKFHTTFYINANREQNISKIAQPIIATGIKQYDAYHVACAIYSNCNYFITVDDRLLKYQTKNLPIITPIEFINIWRYHNGI